MLLVLLVNDSFLLISDSLSHTKQGQIDNEETRILVDEIVAIIHKCVPALP